MRSLGPQHAHASTSGFSAIELAVSLFVITLLIGSIFVPLQSQLEQRRIEETKRLLQEAQDALMGYAAAHGYFPCPADGLSNGYEAAGTDHNTGNCPVWHGFVPAALLGLRPIDASGYALDAWGSAASRIRYAVANQSVGALTTPFTRTNGIRTLPLPMLAATRLLHVCDSGSGVQAGVDCGSALTLAADAAVVVWSLGGNAVSGGTSVHEAENPNANGGSADRIFVSRAHSTAPGNEFDDLLTWVPVSTLVSRSIAAGQFTPSAYAAASPP